MDINQAIHKIENYGASYDPSSSLSLMEQLEICESLAETGYSFSESNNWNKKNVVVNGSVNDSSKLPAKFELSETKLEVITKLRLCGYRTPVFKTTGLLEDLFAECGSREGHWAYISQAYTPKTINSVINRMTKCYGNWKMLQNPAAVFTSLIKHHKKKKGRSL